MTSLAVLRKSDNAVVGRLVSGGWITSPDGRKLAAPAVAGWQNDIYRTVEVVEVGFSAPGLYNTQSTDDEVLSGDTLTITRNWTPWTQAEINAYEAQQDDNEVTNALDMRIARAIFVLVNEVRALKGQSAFDKTQFRTWLKGLR